ncbi:hypothetical protein MYSTI_07760 [Myxococcus stipitatus DSM 14675]|uniref:DUF2169 domain-containing protein n=1 Tax=Myxococcus stipitatus (strain DSM 14675 / JCM 12634 / Mx s8) TaxID=1278073 RepID=L7UN79_MYXSD|nr:DUF2169 domain-containing protein [Myxococcus stipitatus]AGC49032.1 hypothetical protein MYSTI_07760 [Myxococcus stipitatus DSM 14675]
MDLYNLTPFTAGRFVFLDGSGRESLLVVVKATFALQNGRAVVAESQAPLTLADEYRGEPARSSLLSVSDLAPFKPATDVLLEGFAYAGRRSRTEGLVGLRVGAMTKGVQVFGERVWESLAGIPSISAPRPFERMELTWERAFGGTDDSHPDHPERCEANPVGRGFRSVRSRRGVHGLPLPNLEAPRELVRSTRERPPPCSFGPLPPHWTPRARHAGTYDDAWRRERLPLLPEDFDERHHLVAPADQRLSGYVQGGEPVKVVGATPEGALAFPLPSSRLEVIIKLGAARETPPCLCDTVHIDCERKLLTLVWRARWGVHGRVPSLHWVKVQLARGTHVA